MNLHRLISRTPTGYALTLPHQTTEHRRRRDALSHAAQAVHPRATTR